MLFGIQVIAHCPIVFHANKCFHYKIGSFLIIRARWHFTMVCVKLRFPLFMLQNNSENLLQVKQKKIVLLQGSRQCGCIRRLAHSQPSCQNPCIRLIFIDRVAIKYKNWMGSVAAVIGSTQ